MHRVLSVLLAAFGLAMPPTFAPTEVSAISTHPCLVTTPARVELARERVREEPWAGDIVKRLRAEAESLEGAQLPVFETSWWDEAGRKHWSQVYPEINHHTNFAVSGPVLKAYDAALVYAATGEARYAQIVRKVLLHYTGYQFFAEHPDVGLNWSVWCSRALYAYDLVYDALSDADRASIDDFFTRAAEAVRKNDQWWIRENPGGLFNNHFAWHKHFIGLVGLFYGRRELVDYALNADQGIRDLIEHGARDDGLWLESSINYHFTALPALAEFARAMSNASGGIDLWHQEFANGRRLKDLFTGPMQALFPDETIPQIGDTYARRMKLGDVRLYYSAYDAYRDPAMAWILRDQKPLPPEALFGDALPKAAAPPPMKTRLWPEHGYAALRTQEGADYWRGDGYSVFFSFDLDGIHSHHDKLNLIAFGRGAHIAVDAEARSSAQHAFSSKIQNELNHSTLCHNTLMVDRKEQKGISSKLELVHFVNSPEVKLVTAADTRELVYPGVRISRTVAATPDYVLDILQAASDEEHTYGYLFHTLSDSGAFEPLGSAEAIDLSDSPPWKWLRNARTRRFDSDWSVSAPQGDLTTLLHVLGDSGTQVITSEFPADDRFEETPIPMLMAERKAKSTTFVAVLQAERGPLPDVSVSMEEERHGFLRVKVDCGGRAREFSVRRVE